MPKLIDRLLYLLVSDQVKILLDHIDLYPTRFRDSREVWNADELCWHVVARNGVFSLIERLAINIKLRRLDIIHSRNRILEAMVNSNGHTNN